MESFSTKFAMHFKHALLLAEKLTNVSPNIERNNPLVVLIKVFV